MKGQAHAPLLSLEETLTQLLAGLTPLNETEQLSLASSAYRILAETLRSRVTVPGFDNSAMDGYAFDSADVTQKTQTLPISLRVLAGDRPATLTAGSACRIFTGAPLPKGADTVVIQEDCEERDGVLVLPHKWAPGAHIRRAGEDIQAGQILLEKGVRLTPQAIGLAASCGMSQVLVRRRVRVTLLSTGNELRETGGAPLEAGQIYDSNRPMLKALLERMGCSVQSIGPIADDYEATRRALREASTQADVIVTTGGVSVGEEDHVKAALQAEGTLALWRVAIKPGKPLAFGRVGEAYFLGLPGNPVSSFVTFLLFVQPFLMALTGETPKPLRHFFVHAGFTRERGDRRREFMRGKLSPGPDGTLWVHPHTRQSSGVLSSTTWADGLIDIAADRTVAEGDLVPFLPYDGLLP